MSSHGGRTGQYYSSFRCDLLLMTSMSSNVVRTEYSRSIITRPDINPHSPVCSRDVLESRINDHLDKDCSDTTPSTSKVQLNSTPEQRSKQLAPIFGSANKQHVARTASLQIATQKRRMTEDNASPIPGPSKRSKTTKSKFASAAPLAERLRPQTLEEFVGQPQLTGPDSLLLSLIHKGSTGSMIFWGPPGYMRLLLLTGDDTDVVGWCPCRCGKTTLARLLAKSTDAAFKELSATDSGISDVRAVGEEAKGALTLTGRYDIPPDHRLVSLIVSRRTILFLDEVHRFNKAQQVSV